MEGRVSCIECTNKLCYIQQYCSPNWISILSGCNNQQWYEKGQYIFREGNRIFGLYFIKEGKVKIISTGLNNKEQIVRLANVGHVIGHKGFEHEIHRIGAVALEDTHICFFDNEIIYDAFMHNAKLTFALMMFYSKELRRIEIRERHLTQMTTREKVADALLYLKEVFGMNPLDDSLNAVLSRQEIADIAGTHSEQVVREFKEFENERLIAKQNKKIRLINLEGLLKIVAAHSSNRYFTALNLPDSNVFPQS